MKTESEILRTPNFGKKSLNEIKANLQDLGLSFNMKKEGWPPKENIDDLVREYKKQQQF